MSVHNSDYNLIFLFIQTDTFLSYSLEQTLKYLLKVSILCFIKEKKNREWFQIMQEKYKLCKVLCSLSFSLFKKI